MSYTPRQQGTGGSNEQQVQQSKSSDGISEQMQTLFHSQNALPETSQSSFGAVNFANLNITLQQQQQQRFESIIKQQQLLFSAASPQIKHFQQQSAKDLVNKSLQHQQQVNGSTSTSIASNLVNQQLHQQLQALAQNPTNLMQHLQAYQFQMQQQKMMSVNQAPQTLNQCPIDVQNVTQQHMQQIQQTLQQQKLLMSHTKIVPPISQLKSVTPGTSASISIPNSSTKLQLDNLNKNVTKGTVSPAVQAKQIIPSNSTKTLQIQTKPCITPSSSIKPVQSPQITTKSQHVNYPSKAENVSVSLTRTLYNTPSSSSRSATVDQQSSKSANSQQIAVASKALNTQHSLKLLPNTDTSNDNLKHDILSVSVDGAKDTSNTTPVVKENDPDLKKSEELKLLEKTKKENKQKDKITFEILKEKESKKSDTINVEGFGQAGLLSKDKELCTQLGNEPVCVTVLCDEGDLQSNKTVTNSEKSMQKVSFKLKSNQRKMVAKNEQEKVQNAEKLMSETFSKENCEKNEFESEKIEQENQNEKGKKETSTLKHKIENEKEKTGKLSKVNKENLVVDVKTSKTDKKGNLSEKGEKIVIKPEQSTLQFSVAQNHEGRSKRHRLKTILYQSPLPELAYITKLSVTEASKTPQNMGEKLTLFYKTEYLAVRNVEDGFFICKTLQNVYKSSKRIRIRWFSEEKKDSTVYKPDFYDNTDLECILTTVEMEKISKDRFKLSKAERLRIGNILKKTMDVEKGITPRPDITEENPDGLDISLLKAESQLLKRVKRASSTFIKRNRMKPSKQKKCTRRKEENSQGDENDEYNNSDTDMDYKPKRSKQLDISFDVGHPKLRRQRLSTRAQKSPVSLEQNGKKQSIKHVPFKTSPKTKKGDSSKMSQTSPTNKKERPKRKAVESVISYDEGLVGIKRLPLTGQSKKDEIFLKAKDNAITSSLENDHSSSTTEFKAVPKGELSDILLSTSSNASVNITKTLTNTSIKKNKTPSNASIVLPTPDITLDTTMPPAPSFEILNRTTRNRK